MQVQKKETTLAILMFTAVMLGNAVIFAIIPYLTQPDYGFAYHPFQIMLTMCGVALLLMLPWAKKQGLAGLKTKQWKLYGARGFLEYGAFVLSFFSLGYLGAYFTLPMHTALNFITPLLATVAAMLILKEKGYAHTWLALLFGFAGVLVITRPGMIPLSPGVLYVLGAATGFSLCGIVIKLLTRTESAQHVAFYMLLMTTLLALPAGLYHWTMPNLEGALWLGLIGLIAYLQQVWVAKAIAKVPYMMLIPLNFTTLIFSTALSSLVYGHGIDRWTLVGALIIFASTLYNAHRNRVMAETEAKAIEATVA